MVLKDEVKVYDSLLMLMADTDDKDKLGTLLEIKESLKDYSLSKLRSLNSILIDSLNGLAKYKENMKEALEKY